MTPYSRMQERLPLLYQEGTLIGGLLDHLSLQLELAERDLSRVHQAHFFSTAMEREDVDRLAALLGLQGEDWMHVGQIKAWVRAMRQAIFNHGAVTPKALLTFVRAYLRELQTRPDSPQWVSHSDRLGLVAEGAVLGLEEQPHLRRQFPANQSPIEPLTPFEVVHQGLDTSQLSFSVRAIVPMANPLFINDTNHRFITYKGSLKAGQRLWITANQTGLLQAQLERFDVSSNLLSGTVDTLADGRLAATMDTDTVALDLQPGVNVLRFFPVAITGGHGMGQVFFGFPPAHLRQTRLDQFQFGQAIFFKESPARISLSWLERCRASFRISIDVGKMRYRKGQQDRVLAGRDQLLFGLNQGIETLKGAGIRGWLAPTIFRETQPQRDFHTQTLPLRFGEGGSVGRDRLSRREGSFGLSGFDEASLA